MIPYFEWHTIQLGPVTLQVWGLFVALGALVALLLSERAGKRFGVKKETVDSAVFWMLIAGFLGARIGHAVFYNPAPFLQDPLEFFRIWHGGLSSLGGFVGALAALFFLLRRKSGEPPLTPPWEGGETNTPPFQKGRLGGVVEKYFPFALTDSLAMGFPLGWAIGRIGCFLIHDHPGTLSHSILAVRYPGGSRFDLGLIEALTGLFVFALALVLFRRFPKRGVPTVVVTMSYLALRFGSDFLRATDLPGSDPRILGLLTPAQIGAVILLAGLAFIYVREWKKGNIFASSPISK